MPARAEPTLVALTTSGALLVLDAERPAAVREVRSSGTSGRLVALDTRPADGQLYGLTDGNDLYRLDPASGAGTLVATLTLPFDGGDRSGMDFNPQTDRLKLESAEGANLRVHPTLGATAADRPLAFADGDPHAGRRPQVTAIAYTSNTPGTPTTRLFVIDAGTDVLAVQEPPNEGRLATVGPLGVDFGPRGGFDIVSGPGDRERAWTASGNVLYSLDLATGAARPVGTIAGDAVSVVGLAALRP